MVWNLAAQLLPLAVALVCIPFIIQLAGVARFGVLTLAWALIGYSALFDLGLGRALTKTVAEQLAGDATVIAPTIWTGLAMMSLLGLIGAAGFYALAPWLAESALGIPEALVPEAVTGFRLIALAVPLVTLTAGLRGVAESYQQFRRIAGINAILGILSYGGPLVALAYSATLPAAVMALIGSRLLGLSAFAMIVMITVPDMPTCRPAFGPMRRLLRFGSWLTVSSVVGPVMDYMDRFIVGAFMSVEAVAYYATPFDLVGRLRILFGPLTGVLFPAFSMALVADRPRAVALYSTGIRHTLVIVTPAVLIVILFAEEGLSLWLGPEFAQHGAPVAQWLAIGQLISAMAAMPYALLQAAGRPDLTARLHLLELPVYLVLVWLLIATWGITGAAAAWTLRVLIDTLLLFVLSSRVVGVPLRRLGSVLGPGSILLAMAAGATCPDAPADKVSYLLIALGGYGFVTYRWLLEPGESTRLIGYLRSPRITSASRWAAPDGQELGRNKKTE
jgi:O-antigen/teichoic acid export membrane protein